MPDPSPPIPLKPPRTRRIRRAPSQNGGTPGGPRSNGAPVTGAEPPPRDAKPKLRKLRLLLVLIPVIFLALASTIFGMLLSVAHQLPQLENEAELRAARKSTLVDARDKPLATLTGNSNRILLSDSEISPTLKNAVIAIEDRRFYGHEGVDYKGIARALWQDIRQQSAVQGGSTITQQFVKNALTAQGDRSVFQKMRESALAYHLEREWSKQKILNQYLNTVYFGNGAYGIESAARTYFGEGRTEFDPDYRAAQALAPHEAALLAGIIASPTAYDPIQNPKAAKDRRDLVLDRMLEQGMITQAEHGEAVVKAIPSEDDITPPQPDSDQPYFTSWATQQLVDRYGSGVVFGGGLEVETTIDLELQAAAEQAIQGRLGGLGPSSSLVVIENKTAEVKAMVGGFNFESKPFNLATNGHRQPGSAFKPFILAQALESGISSGSVWSSTRKEIPIRVNGKRDEFVVNNYEDSYSGSTTLASATAQSDNSVYAELGLQLGTKKIAKLANRMGIQTKLSTNPAMVLGGLTEGVTPLEMAYAYSTIANKGRRVSGSLAAGDDGPVAIKRVEGLKDEAIKNERETTRVFSEATGNTMHTLLQSVVSGGTGTRAAYGGFAAGKTGTTENYGDAWFVGFNEQYTVAVWVGYPDRLRFMTTEFAGQPVAGGTYPALIWHDFMVSAKRIADARGENEDEEEGTVPIPVPTTPAAPAAPSDGGEAAPEGDGGAPNPQPSPPRQPQPPRQPPAQPAPAPAPGPGGGAAPGAAE
jgi:penicillin-binding protein 1A